MEKSKLEQSRISENFLLPKIKRSKEKEINKIQIELSEEDKEDRGEVGRYRLFSKRATIIEDQGVIEVS